MNTLKKQMCKEALELLSKFFITLEHKGLLQHSNYKKVLNEIYNREESVSTYIDKVAKDFIDKKLDVDNIKTLISLVGFVIYFHNTLS